MAFEGSRFEDRGGNEEQMREHAPDLSMPEEAHPDAPPLTERAVAPDAREGIRAPEALAAPAPRERMEPTSEEALAARLDEARAAYAQAWIHEDNLPQEEKDRVFREYLAAVSAMRARQKEHFAQDPSRTPAERARTMEQMILSFTAEERKRLMQARDAVRIAQRDAAAVASHGRYIMEDYREAAALFGRGTRHVAEWYRSIPPQYRFAIGAGLFAATAGGAYLGLPLLVAAGGGARMATRMLGGGSAALGADAGMQWLQDRKAQREIFGAKQESTWNPDLHFSWNPMRMAAGLFRREATAEQSIEWADQLEAIIKDDDDTRLNDAFIGQARRAGHEKRNRVLIAGLVFTAVAIGMPGKGFRFVGEQTGATEAIRSRAQAWAHDLSHGGIAEAATNQEVSGAPSQRETLYAKIRRWRGVGAPTTASTDAAPKKPAIDKPRTIADPSKIKQVRETLLPQERILVEKRLKEIDQEFQRMNAEKSHTPDLRVKARIEDQMNQLGDEYDSLDAQLKVTDAPGGKAAPAPAKIETQPALETREAIQQQIDNLRAQERASFRKSDNDQTLDGDAKRALADERVEARRKVKLLQEKLDQTKPKSAAAPGPSADVAKSEPQPTSKIGIPPQAAPAPATAEPGAKAETPAPPVETPPPAPTTQEPPPTTAVKPTEATAPRTAAEMSARARAVELATVHKGEGAWQAVRRQMYARLYDDTQKNPTKYGMSAEQAAKLPKDMEHPPKTGKIAKILNRETLATLKQAGYINEDGTTKIGMRPDARVILESDNRVTVANPEKTTYVFQEHKGGARHPADETRRASGRVGAPDATHDPKTHGSTDTSHTPDSELEHLNKRSDLDQHPLAEIGPRPEGATPTPEELRATAETAAIKTESANLRTAHLTPTEYRPITRMKGETFIKELARHAAEIREHQVHGPRKNFSIFINNGSFTGRGFTAGLKEAGKYLDLSERLEKHLDKMSWTPRQRLLKQPIGELLRIVNLKK